MDKIINTCSAHSTRVRSGSYRRHDGINEEEEEDEKRLEKGLLPLHAAAHAAVLVRGQILSTCCTRLDALVGGTKPVLLLLLPGVGAGGGRGGWIPLPHLSPSLLRASSKRSIELLRFCFVFGAPLLI